MWHFHCAAFALVCKGSDGFDVSTMPVDREVSMNIAVIGDSYAAGVGAPKGTKNWLDLLEIPAALRGGISGTTAGYWARVFENDNYVRSLLAKLVKYPDCRLCVSLMGNDMLRALKDEKVTVQEVLQGMKNLQSVLSSFSTVQVPVYVFRYPVCFQMGKKVALLNNAIDIACRFMKHGPVPLDTLFTNASYMARDGIHPGEKGHYAIASFLSKQ